MAQFNDPAEGLVRSLPPMQFIQGMSDMGDATTQAIMALLQRLGLAQGPTQQGVVYGPNAPLPQVDPNHPGQIIQPSDLRKRMVR